ncbi:MAG: vitamin B12-dependent ribonucleotide reductase, partial [Nanoarchaeota archaeon]|nr:vitamin B12-dependent ribonucleotide reductase [Nanoarchaeota archaeon]
MAEQLESVTMGKQGLSILRYYTKDGISPFDMFTYEKRTSAIKNSDGSTVFSMQDVEVPHFWSQVATDILAQKYFRKAGVPLRNEQGELLLDENGKIITGRETSIKQVAHRIAGCWRSWGEKEGYFSSAQDAQIFYEEMAYMIIGQYAAPNSPQWFTTGLNFAYGLTGPAQGHSYVDSLTQKLEYSKDAYSRSQPHACFIQSVDDDMVNEGGIMDLWVREARLFKFGSGTGTNFSKLRGAGEPLSGGGKSSGLMSFLKIGDRA